MKKYLNKWQFVFENRRDYSFNDSGWLELRIGLIKFTSFPEQGASFSKKHYKGLLIKFSYWFPIRDIWINKK